MNDIEDPIFPHKRSVTGDHQIFNRVMTHSASRRWHGQSFTDPGTKILTLMHSRHVEKNPRIIGSNASNYVELLRQATNADFARRMQISALVAPGSSQSLPNFSGAEEMNQEFLRRATVRAQGHRNLMGSQRAQRLLLDTTEMFNLAARNQFPNGGLTGPKVEEIMAREQELFRMRSRFEYQHGRFQALYQAVIDSLDQSPFALKEGKTGADEMRRQGSHDRESLMDQIQRFSRHQVPIKGKPAGIFAPVKEDLFKTQADFDRFVVISRSYSQNLKDSKIDELFHENPEAFRDWIVTMMKHEWSSAAELNAAVENLEGIIKIVYEQGMPPTQEASSNFNGRYLQRTNPELLSSELLISLAQVYARELQISKRKQLRDQNAKLFTLEAFESGYRDLLDRGALNMPGRSPTQIARDVVQKAQKLLADAGGSDNRGGHNGRNAAL